MGTNKKVSGASAVVELTPEIVMAVLTELGNVHLGNTFNDEDVGLHMKLGGRELVAASIARRIPATEARQFAMLGFFRSYVERVYPLRETATNRGMKLRKLRELIADMVSGSRDVSSSRGFERVLDMLSAIERDGCQAERAWVAVARCACWILHLKATYDGSANYWRPDGSVEICASELAAALTGDLKTYGDAFLKALDEFVRVELPKLAPAAPSRKAKRGGRRAA